MIEGREHGGIILITDQQMSVGAQLRALLNIAAVFSQVEPQNRILFLGNWVSRDQSGQ